LWNFPLLKPFVSLSYAVASGQEGKWKKLKPFVVSLSNHNGGTLKK
jgi:hypothetical protein